MLIISDENPYAHNMNMHGYQFITHITTRLDYDPPVFLLKLLFKRPVYKYF